MRKRFILITLILFLTSGCGKDNTPPVYADFKLHKKGEFSELNFEIKEERVYQFRLILSAAYPLIKTTKEITNDEQKQTRAKAVFLELFKVDAANNKLLFFEGKFENISRLMTSSRGTYYLVTSLNLPTGDYTAKITSLDDIKWYERQRIKATFEVDSPRYNK